MTQCLLLWPDKAGGEKGGMGWALGFQAWVFTHLEGEPGMRRDGACLMSGARGWLSHTTAKFQSLVITNYACQGKRIEHILFNSLLA